jgi:hypothetical protein
MQRRIDCAPPAEATRGGPELRSVARRRGNPTAPRRAAGDGRPSFLILDPIAGLRRPASASVAAKPVAGARAARIH